MAGYRVALVLVVLVLAVPLLTMGTASAAFLEHRSLPIRPAAHWIPPRSGVVSNPVAPPRALAVDANATLLPVGAQYRVTNNAGAQNEVSIALNPRNSKNIVVSANDWRAGSVWCGVYTTMDGGRTWIEQLVPRNGNLSLAPYSGDPAVAFDGDGNAYVSCLGFGGIVNVITVTKSTDGGRTWGTAQQVVGAETNVFHDKSYMTVDTSSGPNRGTIYVTWTRFLSDSAGNYLESPIYFSRSTDGGTTWSPEKDITSGGYKYDQGSQPVVGPASELYVSWVAGTTGGNRVAVAKSTDGGTTWGATMIVNTLWDPGELYGGGPRTPHFPSIAVNLIDAPGGNRVHVVWADRRFGNADILMSTSVNGGLTWGSPVRVNDDATANAQFFPWVAASANGKVFVSFYDRRDDPGDRLLTVYVATSTDFGVSFAKNVRASAQFDPGNWFIGDYNGLAASGDFAFPVWCDLRNGGEEEVYMAGPPIAGTGGFRMMNP